MRYLVTGGSGFIGSNMVDELVRGGRDVVVLDDLSTGKAENLANAVAKVKFIQDSVTNLAALREACRGVDCVIHLAAQTSVPRSVIDPIETNLVNVNGLLNILVAACEAKPKRVVFASSCAVYGKTPVLDRDGWRCQSCGRTETLQVHHIQTRARLGDDSPNNLIILCARCHQEVHRQGHTVTLSS